VANNVPSFAANIRKLVYCLWRSLDASDNVLINATLYLIYLLDLLFLDGGETFCFIFLFFAVDVFFSLYNAAWALSRLLNVNEMNE